MAKGKIRLGAFSKAALLGSAALLLSSAFAQAAPLSEVLRDLVSNHPEIKSADNNVSASQDRIDEARGRYFPTVNLFSEAGGQVLDNQSRRAAGQDTSRLFRQKYTLSVTQNVFNGFQTRESLSAAKASSLGAAAFKESVVQRLMVEGAIAYINVIRGNELIKLARSNEATIQEQLELEDERVKRGSGISVDVLQAKSRLQLSIERRVGFQGRQRRFISDYQRLFGALPERVSVEEIDVVLDDALPEDLQQGLDTALEENPQIIQSKYRVAELGHQKEVASSGFYPSIDIVGSYNVENNVDATRGYKRDATILVQANWDLFSGFQTEASTHAASHTLAASRNDVGNQIRNIERQVRDAWADLLTARERSFLLRNAVNIAQEVFDSRKKLRESGKETALNVLDAESEVFNARINLVEAEFDRRIAEFRLVYAMGLIGPDSLGLN